MTWLLPISVCLLLLVGCGGGLRGNFAPVPDQQSVADPESDFPGEDLSAKSLEELYAKGGIANRDPALEAALANWEHQVKFDVPIEVNQQVKAYLIYFSTERKGVFSRWLARSTRYLPMIKEVFREHGLPEDLGYLAMIESGFNPDAGSPAGAVGLWQFIKGTGLRYGLVINGQVDERRDPVKSTHAAARYLSDLYKQFGSWYLAAASYNCGERRVQNELRKTNLNNFWELSANRCLPSETKNYVPQMIAATVIAKNPEKFGFNKVPYQAPASKIMLASAPPPPPLVRERRHPAEAAPARPEPVAGAALKAPHFHAQANHKVHNQVAAKPRAGKQPTVAQAKNHKAVVNAKSPGPSGVVVASMFGSPRSTADRSKAVKNNHHRQAASSSKKAKTNKAVARQHTKKSPALLARKVQHTQSNSKIAARKKSKSNNKKVAARNKGLVLSQAR